MPTVGLRLNSAQAIVNQYMSVIDQAMAEGEQYSVAKIEETLETKLRKIELMCHKAFSALGYHGSLEANEAELNAAIAELQKGTANLNGDKLNRTFIAKFQAANPFDMDLQQQYDALLKYLDKTLSDAIADPTERLVTGVVQILKGTIGNTIYTVDENNNRVRSKSTGQFAGYKFDKIFANLSRTTQNKLNIYFKEHELELNDFQEQQTDLSTEMTWLIENVSVESFLKMSPTAREKVLTRYEKYGLKDVINEKFKESILAECPDADQGTLADSIDHVLQSKDVAFFIGGQSTLLTGILGEIQGLYYINTIIRKRNLIQSSAKWVGGINNPHADILLQSALGQFGIQIKNSSWDRAENELYQIEFQGLETSKSGRAAQADEYKTQLTNPASQAISQLGISSEVFENLFNALAAYTFNIPYEWREGEARPVNVNIQFDELRKKIEEYEYKANQIMSLYSAALMYMQTSQYNSDASANTFYLIAGATIYSSATILANIIRQLKAEVHDFKATVTTRGKLGSTQYTIVDILNHNRDNMSLFQKAETMHVAFRSSYNFV